MKAFQDIIISGHNDQFEQLTSRIEGSLRAGWERGKKQEAYMSSMAVPGVVCFTCSSEAKRPAAALWLAPLESGKWHVSNIVPSEKRELSLQEYNRILVDFAETFVLPVSTEIGFSVTITKAEKKLEDIVSLPVQRALESFSALANKSTGSSHPSDKERWYAFLVEAHKGKCDLDVTTLKKWLIEEEEWPEEAAFELAIEYENGRGLLDYYETHNG
jgi:hypothetical protein